MSEQVIARPNFYDHGERMSRSQFRETYENVERILALSDAPDLMSFGPSILPLDEAVEDGWLGSTKEFHPMLRSASVAGLYIELDGVVYTGAKFFFKQGGNKDASKKWLGDVHFVNDTEELGYNFQSDGTIELVRRSASSRWLQHCWARGSEAIELNTALIKIKEHLHVKKAGQLAVSSH